MRFAFTEEQRLIQGAVRDLLHAECPPAEVRRGCAPAAWAALGDMGVLDMLAPTSEGGLGLTMLDLVLPLEEAGRVALPEPIIESAAVRTEHAPQCAAAFERGAVGAAAMLLGLTDGMLAMTVAHATSREQFGRPIGSFQAVKHHLADARLALDFARPTVYAAAWALCEDEPDGALQVSLAKAMASDAARVAARKALQVHGAIGYTEECDLHLWMRRAWEIAAAWGDARWHRRRIGQGLFEPLETA